MKRGTTLTPALPWAAAAPKHRQTRPGSPAFACFPRAAQTIPDEALMARIVNYDRSAMHMLYARHHVRVYRFALRVLAKLEQAGLADPDPDGETGSPRSGKKGGR